MNIREWMNENSATTTVAAVVVLVLALGFAIYHLTKSGGTGGLRIQTQYFYDANTGNLFAGPAMTMPPIDVPSGTIEYKGKPKPAGFRAFVIACGGCTADHTGKTPQAIEQTGARVAYLQSYTKAAREMNERMMAGDSGAIDPMHRMKIEGGQLLGRVPANAGTYPKFVTSMGSKGNKLNKEAMKLCPDGSLPKQCHPDQ